MPARCARLLPPIAALVLGCASSVGVAVGGGGAAVEVRGSTNAGPADPSMCMYDRASGQLRTCLHFGFGQCAMFGDTCSKEPEPAAPGEAPPVVPSQP